MKIFTLILAIILSVTLNLHSERPSPLPIETAHLSTAFFSDENTNGIDHNTSSDIVKRPACTPPTITVTPSLICVDLAGDATGTFAITTPIAGQTYTWDFGVYSSGSLLVGPGPFNVPLQNLLSTSNVPITVSMQSATCSGITETIDLSPYLSDITNLSIESFPTQLCKNELGLFQVADNSGTSYTWDFGADASPLTMTGAGGHFVDYSTTGVKTVSLTITKQGCSILYEQDITIIGGPGANAGPDVTICGGGIPVGTTHNPDATYIWSPSIGLSSQFVANPIVSPTTTTTYNLILVEGGCTTFDEVVVSLSAELRLSVWLEGPYDPTTGLMNTYLNLKSGSLSHRGVLPGQTPVNGLGVPTPAGQPYSVPPWNYMGTEGIGWTNAEYEAIEIQYGAAVVDWVLVSGRSEISASTTFFEAAALLLEDGRVAFPDGCPYDQATIPTQFYIVIEHRSHMGVMTPNKIPFSGVLSWDFRGDQSYASGAGFGQKEIAPGVYTMYAGDGEQVNDVFGYDINGNDKISWQADNGRFDRYLPSDYTMDADVTGLDNILWNNNNGIFSAVPK